jgi:hypothetical protein
MKSLAVVLSAAAIFAGVALAQISDNGANARFHMKTGRDLPGAVASAPAPAQCCSMAACKMTVTPSASQSDAEQRFHEKTGRYTPAEEARIQPPAASQVATAMPVSDDAAQRVHMKTGRRSSNTVAASAASVAECVQMSCCQRRG